MSLDGTREPGIACDVFDGMGEFQGTGPCLYLEIVIQFANGEYQSFAVLPKTLEERARAIHALCTVFGVGDFDDIRNHPCIVLRCWPRHQEPIEGLEVDGRRFTLTAFARNAKPPIERRRQEIEHAQQSARRRLSELSYTLEHLRDQYVDWG
jgi:hypothetical protein